jgi:LuxR family maltose regulon positive regulatory protein
MDGLDQQRAGAPTTSLPRPVQRQRLLDELGQATEHGSAVLTAPAGLGKSILLEQWTAEANGRPIGRVTLHRRDEARQVAGGLIAALERVGATISPDTLRLLHDNARGLGDLFVSSLLADLESAGDVVVVVIDGLDAPADARLVEELEALVRHAPPHVHFVVARRSHWRTDPHRPGSSLGGTPFQLGEDDLAFRPEEARQLIEEVANRCLTDEQLHALLARTQGWPVALRLAAIALRRAVDVDALVRNFGGDDRYLRGYLDEEMISGQPAVVRDFLTRTSVLHQMSGSLCDELTGRSDGAAMLRNLARQGVFTRCIRPGGVWFTYHPLFRDRLRHELRHSRPGVESAYLGRAARWHLARDDPEAAARYLIEAGDWRELVAMIDRSGRQSFESGTIARLSHWLGAVPGSRRPGRNDLLVRHAYLDTLLGDIHRAEQTLRDLDRPALSPGEEVATEALRATWVWWGAPEQPAISHADAALERLDTLDATELPDILGLTSSASLRLIASSSRARALWHLGDVAASRRSLTLLVERRNAYPPWSAQVAGALALLEAWAGNLRAAEKQARHALGIAARARLLGHPATLDARLALAHVARERALLGRAIAHLDDVETIAGRNPRPVARAIHAIERSLGHLAAGHAERGIAEIDRCRTSGDPPAPPLVSRRRRAVEARLLVARGDAGRARALVNAEGRAEAIDLAIAAAHAALAQGDLGASRSYLDHATTAGAQPHDLVEHRLWCAVVDLREGDRHRALAQASAIVADAEPEGYVRLFLDGGPPVEQLMRELRRSKPTPYVHRLVQSATPASRTSNGHENRELSDRELDVVRYLPTPLSSSEIAAQLYIALTTLKTHLRSIYRKLGVTCRRDAAARAQELGLA